MVELSAFVKAKLAKCTVPGIIQEGKIMFDSVKIEIERGTATITFMNQWQPAFFMEKKDYHPELGDILHITGISGSVDLQVNN